MSESLREYGDVVTLEEARRLVAAAMGGPEAAAFESEAPPTAALTEAVPLGQAAGRVLAESVEAAEDVPGFHRSTVDGYAVIAADTYGAGEAAPSLLVLAGAVLMGRPAERKVAPGEAVAIPTGGALPPGADAVVMIEHTASPTRGVIEVTRPVAPGDNVIRAGEDIARGDVAFPAGRRLTPADLGLLASVGVGAVPCRKRPRVAIIPTGDEVVPASAPACGPGQVRDITSASLSAYVERDGGVREVLPIVRDDEAELARAVESAAARNDMVIILGGSSVGARDNTAAVVDRLGPPGVVFHGLALKPGKPTIFGMGRAGGAPAPGRLIPIFGLPGHPVSGLVAYRLVARPALRLAGGESLPAWERALGLVEPSVSALLDRAVPSDQGRDEYLCVRLMPLGRESGAPAGARGASPGSADSRVPRLVAEPVFGKPGLITTLSRADGLVHIPRGARGLEAGTTVEVMLLA